MAIYVHLSGVGRFGKIRKNGRNLNRGLTLIEVMVASLAVFVVVVGAMNFQYYCAMDARKADVRATAGRLGLLLLEAWKTVEGDADYDPVSPDNVCGLLIRMAFS